MRRFFNLAVFICLICLNQYVQGADLKNAAEPRPDFSREVIDGEVTWSGVKKIGGIVVVKKGARLNIKPGTKILFPKIDIDGDSIGDCEIIVEGALLAIGTKEQPIIFTSAEEYPDKRDWKFIMVNFSKFTKLEYCVIEYALSGIQVHFSAAEIQNCQLRHNEDGMRFSTAKVTLEHNDIYDNTYGLRYEERGSQSIIRNNNITNNDYGVFCVIRSEDLSQFRHNNIYNNRKYNLMLGNRQSRDLTMPNNYWGSKYQGKINATIFDKNDDKSLGKVTTSPFLKKLNPNAGVE